MDIEREANYIKIIDESFRGLIGLLKDIQINIVEYPTEKQLEFIAPLKDIIFEAWQDSTNKGDTFLNS